MPKFADLKNDFVFRKVFGHHPLLTKALLNEVLDLQNEQRIDTLELLSPEQAPEVAGAKLSILDVKCKDQTGRVFVVELQLLHVKGFLNRVVYNACKAYTGQLSQGHKYHSLADVIALSVCNFTIWPDNEQLAKGQPLVPLVSRWNMREQSSGMTDLLQVQYAFLEIPKLRADGQWSTLAEQWAWLFQVGEFEGSVPNNSTQEQRAVLALANTATFTQSEQDAYIKVQAEIWQAEQLSATRFEAGVSKGREEGIAEGKRQAELQLLRDGIVNLCRVLGIALTEAQQTHLQALVNNGALNELRTLQEAIIRDRACP